MKLQIALLALGVSALLVACGDDSPIVSAEVRAPDAASRALSARQVQFLNDWLDTHASGWSRLVLATPPPTYALAVTLHHQAGDSAMINFYSQEGWKGGLMYWGVEPSANRQGKFEVDEVIALRRELEKSQ